MKEILNVARLEFITLKKKLMVPSLLLIGLIVFGSMVFTTQIVSVLTMLFAGYLVQPIFTIAERNSFNKLYGVLPAKKRSFIFGRFFLVGVVLLTIMAVFIIVGYILYAWMPLENIEMFRDFVYLTKEWERDGYTIGFSSALGFFIGCAFSSQTFVIDYVFGISKEAPMTFGLGCLVGVLAYIAHKVFKPDYEEIIQNMVKFFVDYRFLSYVVLIGGGILLLALGAVISHLATRKREL